MPLTLEEFRREFESYRSAANRDAAALKDPYIALGQLRSLYNRFDPDERSMADRVISDWALSDDDGVRFDALVLIDEFKVADAIPTLATLVNRLDASTAVGAPYELQKVRRIMARLAAEEVRE